jgi:hypothetical protein
MTRLRNDDPRIQAVLGNYGDSRVGAAAIERGDSSVGFRVGPDQIYDLDFYDDNGKLVGMLGGVNEVHFLAPYADKRGSMYVVDRTRGSGADYQVVDFNCLSDEPPGPDKPEWSKYLGEYQVLKYGVPYRFTATITVKNGYLYYNDFKCTEHEPGLFFGYDGEALDFRSQAPTFGNIRLFKK